MQLHCHSHGGFQSCSHAGQNAHDEKDNRDKKKKTKPKEFINDNNNSNDDNNNTESSKVNFKCMQHFLRVKDKKRGTQQLFTEGTLDG